MFKIRTLFEKHKQDIVITNSTFESQIRLQYDLTHRIVVHRRISTTKQGLPYRRALRTSDGKANPRVLFC